VHRGDEQRRQAAVNLFVHDDDRQSFIRRLTLAEQTLAELVPAIGQSATGTVRIRLGIQMLARFDCAAAPRAGRALVWRANPTAHELIATSLLDRFDGIIGAVGRRAATDPEADAERRLSPAGIAVFKCLATN